MIGKNDKKLQIAAKFGISGVINIRECDPAQHLKELTNGRLADFVLECSGSEQMVSEIIRISANKAVAALIGFYNSAPKEVDFSTLVEKEMTFIGIMGEYGNIEAVSKLMAENSMRLSEMITDEKPFDECLDALSVEDHSCVIKTMIKISEENAE